MKSWSLFLDDERSPPMSIPDDWVISRTVAEAKNLIDLNGLPWRASLDHDLGDNEPTGYDFMWWLVRQDLDGRYDLTTIRSFYVHSQNPVGAENINKLYNGYTKFKG